MDQYANNSGGNNSNNNGNNPNSNPNSGNNSSNNIPTTSSYSSLPSIAPQQLQHNNNNTMSPHTLPPLQAQHAAMSMHSMYGQQTQSAPHTPTSTQPNTPGSVGNGGFSQMGGQPAPRNYHLQQNHSYQQSMQPYNNSSAMMPQVSGPMSHPHAQAIAPAPAPTHSRLVPLRPMTTAAPLHPQHPMHQQMQGGMGSPYGHSSGQDEVPTHVVGSQGRRGILPSAPGRPAVTATGPGASKNAMIPAKDADGKFPCPHCVKTYLHAKHLKRHLLRHTGDRPYMCVLCRDTFSRSDILKRHFQKCSIRRGNPTGASHLSHAQAHLKKNNPSHKNSPAPPAEGDMMRNMNGLNGVTSDSGLHQFGLIPDGRNGGPGINDDQLSQQEHLSRANSIKRMGSGDGRDRRSMTGPTPSGSSRASFDHSYNGDIPTSMGSMNPQMAAYSMPNGHNGSGYGQHYDYAGQSNGNSLHHTPNEDMGSMANGRGPMPMYGAPSNGQQSNLDWSHIYQSAPQDGFMNSYNPGMVQNQMAIKAEPSSVRVKGNGML